jgi:uncharacterized protein (UPF0333 family)
MLNKKGVCSIEKKFLLLVVILFSYIVLYSGCSEKNSTIKPISTEKSNTTSDENISKTSELSPDNTEEKSYSSKYIGELKKINLLDKLVGSWGYEGNVFYELIEENDNLIYKEDNSKHQLVYYNSKTNILVFDNLPWGLRYDEKEEYIIDCTFVFSNLNVDIVDDNMFENLTNNSENYVTKAARTKIQN